MTSTSRRFRKPKRRPQQQPRPLRSIRRLLRPPQNRQSRKPLPKPTRMRLRWSRWRSRAKRKLSRHHTTRRRPLKYSRTPKRHERRRYRGQQSAADGSSDRAALAPDQGAARFWHCLHLLLLLRQANLQRAGMAVRLGGGRGELEIYLHGAAGIFHHPTKTRVVRRRIYLVPDRRDPNLQIRGARPLQARARRVPALPDRHPGLLRAGIDAGLFRVAADAGAVLARHAAGRRRRDRADPAIAEGWRISVADDVADLRVRGCVPVAGDPDAAGPDRYHHVTTTA